ncbi:hypothetical protein BD769DRAFT_1386773 [Suillus cothurnatus]|nr:hypothetical protein BD769DRAFT_1386773 [Suillus cothurnatus]
MHVHKTIIFISLGLWLPILLGFCHSISPLQRYLLLTGSTTIIVDLKVRRTIPASNSSVTTQSIDIYEDITLRAAIIFYNFPRHRAYVQVSSHPSASALSTVPITKFAANEVFEVLFPALKLLLAGLLDLGVDERTNNIKAKQSITERGATLWQEFQPCM